MVDSTATAGNIMKGGVSFIHNFGTENTFIGKNAGNLTMVGIRNTASGESALRGNTTGNLEEQKVLIAARRLRGAGLSLRSVARELNAEGFRSRTGKQFGHVQIARMLG